MRSFAGAPDIGMGAQINGSPRIMTYSHPDSFAPHASHPGRLGVEGRFSQAVMDSLAARGHQVESKVEWTHATGGLCAIQRDTETGQLLSAADPRRMAAPWHGSHRHQGRTNSAQNRVYAQLSR